MNAMGGDLGARVGSLAEYKRGYEPGEKDTTDSKMSADEPLWIALWEADGYQHWHKPDPPDEFWFRPLVCGDKHLTYVGHIPPEGGVPPSPEEAAFVEMCIYTLAGELGCIVLENGDETRFVLSPHHALHAPRHVPLGFWNPGEETASFILTFTPNAPDRNSVAAFRSKATNEYGWTLWQARELNKMAAGTLWLQTE
jgi:hypothetical protein